MSPPPAAVVARGLGREFGSRPVVRDLDLQVAPGEALALTGPNGSGKSTVLRMLATLVRPSTGTATICGHDVRREAGRARQVLGVSFGEDRSWYWRLTGQQNLQFFAALRGVEAPPDALQAVGLGDVTTPVGQWSTGMRSRLGVARALLGDPPVLLLDEPTRAVDDEGAVVLRALLRGQRDRGTAVVLATHDKADIAEATSVVRLG